MRLNRNSCQECQEDRYQNEREREAAEGGKVISPGVDSKDRVEEKFLHV